MLEPVKTPRAYDASRRRAQAGRSRATILAAARERFLADGYAITTLAAVATVADVSVDTIYKAFGSKAGLVKAVYDVAIVGDDDAVALADRPFIQSLIAEPDTRRMIQAYSDFFANGADRVMPILLLVRSAAGDPAVAEQWRAMQNERLIGMGAFAANIESRGDLRPDLPVGEARDIIWTYTAPDIYQLLVLDRQWSTERYGQFISDALTQALLA